MMTCWAECGQLVEVHSSDPLGVIARFLVIDTITLYDHRFSWMVLVHRADRSLKQLRCELSQ
jgi:hypothetical protein